MLKQIASVSFFLGMLPSVIWELLSTLQKNDWLYGIDYLIAKHIVKQNNILFISNKVILAFFFNFTNFLYKLSGLDYESSPEKSSLTGHVFRD